MLPNGYGSKGTGTGGGVLGGFVRSLAPCHSNPHRQLHAREQNTAPDTQGARGLEGQLWGIGFWEIEFCDVWVQSNPGKVNVFRLEFIQTIFRLYLPALKGSCRTQRMFLKVIVSRSVVCIYNRNVRNVFSSVVVIISITLLDTSRISTSTKMVDFFHNSRNRRNKCKKLFSF